MSFLHCNDFDPQMNADNMDTPLEGLTSPIPEGYRGMSPDNALPVTLTRHLLCISYPQIIRKTRKKTATQKYLENGDILLSVFFALS